MVICRYILNITITTYDMQCIMYINLYGWRESHNIFYLVLLFTLVDSVKYINLHSLNRILYIYRMFDITLSIVHCLMNNN